MKAIELKVGDVIAVGTVVHVRSSVVPDKVVVTVQAHGSGALKVLNYFKDAEIDNDKIRLDPEAITKQFSERLKQRLEYGTKTYGPYWNGSDGLQPLLEELLDALVYLWVAEQQRKVEFKEDEVASTGTGTPITLKEAIRDAVQRGLPVDHKYANKLLGEEHD